MSEPFPADWNTAAVQMPHPDDPDFGAAAAAKSTAAGQDGVLHPGMPRRDGLRRDGPGASRAPARSRAAALVGVSDVAATIFGKSSGPRECPINAITWSLRRRSWPPRGLADPPRWLSSLA